MDAPGPGPRRIAPGLIGIAIVILVAGSVVRNWRQEALIAAIRDATLTIAIVAGLLGLLAAIEILLRGRARLWGRVAALAVISAVVLWRLLHGGGAVIAWIAGIAWAAAIGGMIVAMLRNPHHGR